MKNLDDFQTTIQIEKFLKECQSVAVVGLSPKEQRPSNMVGRYLQSSGYTIFPVNPGQDTILGEICFAELLDIHHPIDIVNIFRRSEDILPIVEQVLQLDPLPKVVWMQQGIINEEAARLARDKNIYVVMDRCIKIDHQNYRI